jgi:hypothetical protein
MLIFSNTFKSNVLIPYNWPTRIILKVNAVPEGSSPSYTSGNESEAD